MSHELRITTIEEILSGGLTVQEACERLGVHRSTLWRLLRRYREGGGEGLRHSLTGRRSNRSKPEALRRSLCELFARDYRPHGHSVYFFYGQIARELPEYVSYSTILNWVREGGTL